MNKGMVIPIYFVYLLLMTLMAESLMMATSGGEILTTYGTIEQGTGIIFIWNMLAFAFSLMTLQITGLPWFVQLILFWVPTLIVVFVYIIPTIKPGA